MGPRRQHSQRHAQHPAASPVADSDTEDEMNGDDYGNGIDTIRLPGAFKDSLQIFDFRPRQRRDDLLVFLNRLLPRLKQKFQKLLQQLGGFKFQLVVSMEYISLIKEKNRELVVGHLATEMTVIINSFEINKKLAKTAETIMLRNAHFMRIESSLIIKQIQVARLSISHYNPLAGGEFRELPRFLQSKKAIVNVRNRDERCFGYSLLAALYPARDHVDRAAQYEQYFEAEHLENLNYPVEPLVIPELELRLRININVFTFFDDEGKGRMPMFISSQNFPRSVDLLYWDGHYAWIKKFSAFAFDITLNANKKHFCKRCLGHFVSHHVLTRHQLFCSHENFSKTLFTLAPPNTVCKFTNVRYQQRVPFVIYADFECLTAADADDAALRTVGKTELYQHHIPCSAGLKLISTIPELQNEPYAHYTGANVVAWFMSQVILIQDKCLELLFAENRLIWGPAENTLYNNAQECYLCKKPFKQDLTDKVRDHDHITGLFRGAAHNRCNLMLRKTYKIPVFLHNFKNYDCHLIVKGLTAHPNMKIQVIGQNMEKYLKLSWGDNLEFKDSLMFMTASLQRLTANLLATGRANFRNLLAEFAGNDAVDLLLRKGIYPYDYINDWARFEETELPSRENFYNKLRNEACSTEDYTHALEVWNRFDCATFADYHELYLKADVLQLADVFEHFREVSLSNYGVDPAHYMSAPMLAWDSMLKETAVQLELISDPEIFKMIDIGIRGGVSMITQRYSSANNIYLGPQRHDSSKPSIYIHYVDANNLYGCAMSKTLPVRGFAWMLEEEWSSIDWTTQTPDQDIGYIIECDLDYPAELHASHNEFPLAPERLEITAEMLSATAVRIRTHYHMTRNSNSTKLVPNLMNKRLYKVHYLNLKFYIKHGLKLIRIHRVLKFEQKAWLAPYILHNQDLRKQSSNEVERDFFKLMNNSIYGKTCENQKKRTDIKLVTTEAKRKQLTEKPHCKGFRIFGENLAAIDMRKLQCRIDKPFYVGFCVLELAKLHMYEFHYEYIKPLYADRARLLFTDTDSLMYEIETEDVYKDMWKDRHLYDLTNFPVDSGFNDTTNDKVIGKFKVETGFNQITAFVGLRTKMYAYTSVPANLTGENTTAAKEAKRAKGIARAAVADLRFDDFLKQLNAPTENYLPNRRIGSKLHEIYTMQVDKRGLCSFDDKRFLLADNIHSLAYGHCDIPTQLETVVEDDADDADIVWTAEEANLNRIYGHRRPRLLADLHFPLGIDPAQSMRDARTARDSVAGPQQPDVSFNRANGAEAADIEFEHLSQFLFEN